MKRNSAPGSIWWGVVTGLSALKINRLKLYVLVKAALRVELLLLALGCVFFLVSGRLTWKINGKAAEKFIRQNDSVFYQPGDSLLRDEQLELLNNQLGTLSNRWKVNPPDPRSFYDFKLDNPRAMLEEPDYNKGKWKIAPQLRATPTIFSGLDTIEALSRTDLANRVVSFIDSRKKDLIKINDIEEYDPTMQAGILFYNRYRLDQFVVRGGYGSALSSSILAGLAAIVSLLIITYSIFYYLGILQENDRKERQRELRNEAQKSQEALLVWDLAQKKLNEYYDRNLNQNNSIFIVSIVVMVAGFIVVLYGINIYFQAPEKNNFITGIATASGTIIQFIGATFLVIYNSTIKQAIRYTESLQRTSTIGTSIKILDGISSKETDPEFGKMRTEVMYARIEIAKMLISAPNELKKEAAENAE